MRFDKFLCKNVRYSDWITFVQRCVVDTIVGNVGKILLKHARKSMPPFQVGDELIKFKGFVQLIEGLIRPDANERFTAKDANDQIQKTKNSIKRYQRKQAEVDVVAEQEVEPAEHETPKGHCSVRSDCMVCLNGVPGNGYGILNSLRPCSWNEYEGRCASTVSWRHGKKKEEDGWIEDVEDASIDPSCTQNPIEKEKLREEEDEEDDEGDDGFKSENVRKQKMAAKLRGQGKVSPSLQRIIEEIKAKE